MQQVEVSLENSIWSHEDTVAWAAFLRTKAGSRLIAKLAESVPLLLETGETNALCIRQGVVIGFQQVLRRLLELAEPPAKEQPAEPSAWPALHDDAAWNDGNTLNEKK